MIRGSSEDIISGYLGTEITVGHRILVLNKRNANQPLPLPFPLLDVVNFGVVGTLLTGDPLPMLLPTLLLTLLPVPTLFATIFTAGAAELPLEFFLGEFC